MMAVPWWTVESIAIMFEDHGVDATSNRSDER